MWRISGLISWAVYTIVARSERDQYKRLEYEQTAMNAYLQYTDGQSLFHFLPVEMRQLITFVFSALAIMVIVALAT